MYEGSSITRKGNTFQSRIRKERQCPKSAPKKSYPDWREEVQAILNKDERASPDETQEKIDGNPRAITSHKIL
jgi:hypothetical protein